MAGITISATDGSKPEYKVREILQNYARGLDYCAGVMQNAVTQTIKRHFQTIYPGSSHYSPSKVTNGPLTTNTSVTVVDVPGVTRAYHNMRILPVRAKKLSIPVNDEASKAKSPRNVTGLFYAKNSKGTEMLAKVEGGALVVMYILKDQVNQKQDNRLMPSDKTIAANVFARIKAYLDRRKI